VAKTLYLIDAMAFAFRAYFAIRAVLTDTEGRPTNAVYGFTRVLTKLIREREPSHIAVVFDAPGPTFRDALYPEYKATRRETDPELVQQFPVMHEVVEALNLPLLCVPGVEADDVIGTLARQAAAQGIDTVIVSGDKDLLQLVGPHVRMFDPGKGESGEWFGEAEVVERFGAGPAHVVDALALIGDTADNVPGVRGIGDKTAKKLIAEYGTLENLYAHIDALKGKQKENLIADREQAFNSRVLVTIKTDVPLDRAPESLERRPPDPERLRALFTRLDFHTMLEELGPAAGAEAEEEAPDYRLLLDEAALRAALAEMRAAGCFAVDTETTDVDPMRADLVGVSFSCRANSGYYVPVGHAAEALVVQADPDDLNTARAVSPLPRDHALALLRPLLEDATVGKTGHNIKYDLLVFRRAGIELAGIVMDTMVASYLTDPSRLRHNLDEVSLQYLRRKLIPISDLLGKGSKSTTFDRVPVDRACVYASEDADITWRLTGFFQEQLRERQLEGLFHDVELPLIHVLARMESAGIAIDPTVFESLRTEIEARLLGLVGEIFELAGESFTINSPKQLQGILFEKLGLKPKRRTKTGLSTDMDVLEQLAHEHPLPAKILEYRTLEKLRGTYVEALPRLVNPETGRIHTSYNQAVAATGRLSSSDPNLQNIPIRTELGRRIRAGFVPGAPGRKLISADYSQIELRILAHLSGDAALRAAFLADHDVHTETASRVFGVFPEAVTPDMRRQAKAVNFGVIYGQTAFGLARALGISNGEAARFIEAYFAQYPGVRAWLDATLEAARESGQVTTLLNRRRYIPEFKSSDPNARKAAERVAVNTPVQGSAADIIKLAMLRVDAALQDDDARMLLQVHDELVLEAAEEETGRVAALVREIMEQALPLDVPLKVEVGIGDNWAEIH
jgi:DNA polymerase-1